MLVTGDGVEWLVKTDRGKRKVITEELSSICRRAEFEVLAIYGGYTINPIKPHDGNIWQIRSVFPHLPLCTAAAPL